VGPNTGESQRLQQVYSLDRQKVKQCLTGGLHSDGNKDLYFAMLCCDAGKSRPRHFEDVMILPKVGDY